MPRIRLEGRFKHLPERKTQAQLEAEARLEVEIAERLKIERRNRLKQALSLEQELRSPEFPEPRKGMDGIIYSDERLKRSETVGILIGGLAFSVWDSKNRKDDLNKHKDVDVLVIDPEFYVGEKFSGGIDWWLPDNEYRNGVRGVNGNHAALRFGVRYGEKFIPHEFAERENNMGSGLFIPSPDWIVDMKVKELITYYLEKNHIEEHIMFPREDIIYLIFDLEDDIRARFPKMDNDEVPPLIKDFSSQILKLKKEKLYNPWTSRSYRPDMPQPARLEFLEKRT